jgi:hypothetical protein
MLRRTPGRVLFALLAVIPLSCLHWRHFGHGRYIDCPGGSSAMDVRGVRYCLVTCPGALEDDLRYRGLARIDAVDGALILAVESDDRGRAQAVPGSVPEEVCRALPTGCSCATEACRALHGETSTESGPRSRCLASDPGCGPQAFEHECRDALGYRSAAPRKPMGGTQGVERPCTYDGECFDSGCGYQCLSVHHRTAGKQVSFTCEANERIGYALRDAYCGCVAGNCAWFGQ